MTREWDLKPALQNRFDQISICTPFPFGNAIIVDDNGHETRRGDPPVAYGMISSTTPKIGPGTTIIFKTLNSDGFTKR